MVPRLAPAFGCANQQSLAGGSRVGEMIGSAVVVRLAFLLDQGLDMGGVLDPIALVVTARMAGQDLLSIDDTHPVEISKHSQRSPHMAVWHRVIVLIEADVRCLANCDRHLLNDRIWIVRQLQKVRCLRGEGFADRDGVLIRATPIRRRAAAPMRRPAH